MTPSPRRCAPPRAPQPGVVGRARRRTTSSRAASWAASEIRVGHVGTCRRPSVGALPAGRRPGRDRAGLRHRLRLRLAAPAAARARSASTSRAKQLETARAMQAEHGLAFPLPPRRRPRTCRCRTRASTSPSRSTARSLWCDPDAWIAEAARLLRPGGLARLFLTNSLIATLCSPDTGPAGEPARARPARPAAVTYPGRRNAVEFHLAHGEWIATLRAQHGLRASRRCTS